MLHNHQLNGIFSLNRKLTWITTNTIFTTDLGFDSTINLIETTVIFSFQSIKFAFTLAKATGGSFFAKAAAAFSYSGASRLPIWVSPTFEIQCQIPNEKHLQCPHHGA